MWFWTECSHLIGSERLYIPHSLTPTLQHFRESQPSNFFSDLLIGNTDCFIIIKRENNVKRYKTGILL